jgi:hypothetical protein
MNLKELYAPTSLALIVGSNAFPGMEFRVAGGNTQTVCVPFDLQAAATDVDGAVTNVTLFLAGFPVASASGPTVGTTAEIDLAGPYLFTAEASDDRGGVTWSTQAVTLVSYPLHWIISGGFRTNGTFKICMSGETNQTYQVLAGDDLSGTNWVPIGVMEGTNGSWQFWDTGAAIHRRRFYRVQQLP